ncbi:MAG: dihydrolipoyl dehydrogenase [Bacteroidales bacterium]|jgi:dihydrolipoamide dehydrogenase|nr:dihydrolipoyl dehydrogenase [Bacteroidales bacterium]MDD2264005.1 dihydrolipoyl dehydrogenase [Bacteroidales bacterium]MDD2831239.1 dihydrolipoyl dehydrogenase [Bacteroidales bacterium]MDD3208648.1 dihydrolipoyl dehydrogenase [Bacteroidales bacterium]MDD3697211.1 dihydrolipoyl dehydrogenase [Bacteroidales bacterium]
MSYDLVIIGSGPAGYVAAVRAAQLGFRTAVIEKGPIGGVCLNWGCIPTKALLKSVEVLNTARKAETYGVRLPGKAEPDLAAIVSRSREVASQMAKGIEFLFGKHKVEVIHGRGSVIAPGKVSVEDKVIEAKRILIATGSKPNSLPGASIDGKRIIGYRQAMVPKTIPATMAVIGSGAIGTELAYFYHCLGTKVTLIEYMDQIVPTEDENVAAQLSRSFRKAGIKIMTSAGVKSAEKFVKGCRLEVETRKGTEFIEADVVLSAVGVVPNTANMGLEEAGVQMTRGRIIVDKNFMTSVSGIYAAGDVLPTPALAHLASAEALCCVERMAGLEVPDVDYDNIPGCIYATPEIASVGLREKDAKKKGIDIRIGKYYFTASGKAAAAGERDGFVKLIFDAADNRLLGAHIIGAHATEMIGGLVASRGMQIRDHDLVHSVFPHPTMSEGIMEAAAIACDQITQ